MNRLYPIIGAALLLLTLNLSLSTASAQGTAFTYQGQLQNNGNLANGTYNMTFTLFTTNTAGTPVAGPITNSTVRVTNGLFTVAIDFGSSVWNGETNWLQIGVETNGATAFTALTPRQELTPVPYAITASSIPGIAVQSNTNGAPNLVAGSPLNYAGTEFSGVPVVGATISGGGAANYNGQSYSNIVADNFGTVGGGIGNTAGELDNAPSADPYATVSGGYSNTASGYIATVGGGYGNLADNGAAVGGGFENTAGSGSTVAGGTQNTASGNDATIAGGYFNTASGSQAVVGGGLNNEANNEYATVGGGIYNSASGVGSFIGGGGDDGATFSNLGNTSAGNVATIGGGEGNNIQSGANGAFLGGGYYNTISASNSVIAGGLYNTVESLSDNSAIGGGYDNTIVSANNSTIGGGQYNTIQSSSGTSVIGGGYFNGIYPNDSYSTIGGGAENYIYGNAPYSTIGGGLINVIYGDTNLFGTSVIAGGYLATINLNSWNSFIGGGGANTIGTNSDHTVIVGGYANTIQGPAEYGTIGGGVQNIAGAYAATVPGGASNSATGAASFAAGQHAQALNSGAFVWSDNSTTNPFSSTAANQFSVRALGGVRLVTGGAGMTLDGQSVGTLGNYVFVYNTLPENVSAPGTFQNATFSNDAQLSGWIPNGTSQFLCAQTGLYQIQYTADAFVADSMSIRGALNSTEIPGSQAFVSPNTFSQGAIISKSFLANVSAGSMLTIQYTGNSAGDELQGGGSGSTLPSISLTITRIQ